jgi:hypothetical protein
MMISYAVGDLKKWGYGRCSLQLRRCSLAWRGILHEVIGIQHGEVGIDRKVFWSFVLFMFGTKRNR